jgi:catechol 2,3-dioxygenase-like lactoylglutathione lyase family enzyme
VAGLDAQEEAGGKAMKIPELDRLTTLLEVFDMPRSITFYRDALGFQVVHTSQPGSEFTWALLAREGKALMLNTAYDEGERPAEPEPERVEAHADTALFFGCPDLDGAYEHLLGIGVPAREPTITRYGMRQVWLEDPDGFRICLQCPV